MCYNGIFRALADYSVNVKKYQQAFLAPLPGIPPFLVITLRNVNKHFWRRCWGTVAVVIFEPSLPVYLFFYLFFYPFFYFILSFTFSFIPSFILSLYPVTPFYLPLYLRG